MDRKKLLLLVGALVDCDRHRACGPEHVRRRVRSRRPRPRRPCRQGPKVLVAQRALPVGTIITADAIGFQPWPKELVQDAYFLDGEADMTKLLGTVVRFPITAGEPVTQGALVAPGDRGFLAAALGPGMRAVTVPVSAKTGVAGFVFPGDRVDLMLTQTVKGADGAGAQGRRDHPAQPARARHRPVDRRPKMRRRQDRGPRLPHRHARSDAADRREDRGRPDDRHAQPVAALDRRQPVRTRARDRRGRRQDARRRDQGGGRQAAARRDEPPAATAPRPSSPAATCRASSAAPCPRPRRPPRWRVLPVRAPRRSLRTPAGPTVAVTRGKTSTTVESARRGPGTRDRPRRSNGGNTVARTSRHMLRIPTMNATITSDSGRIHSRGKTMKRRLIADRC